MNKPVLLVDDSLEIREALADLIELEGYKVHVAENGAVALEHLENGGRPGLILLDVMMPVMDGRTFLTRIKHNERAELRRIPILILTAASHDITEGIIGQMRKPIDVPILFDFLTRYCVGEKAADD